MAVNLVTFEPFSAITVGCEGGAFKAISDVAEIRDPSKVDRNSIETYEEAREQKEWDGHHRS